MADELGERRRARKPSAAAAAPGASLPELLTLREAADALHVTMAVLYRLMHDGELRTVKLGYRTTRVRRDDLDSLIDRHTK